MDKITGKYNSAKLTLPIEQIDQATITQIYDMCNNPAYLDDINICQMYSMFNHMRIMMEIAHILNCEIDTCIFSMHNFIDIPKSVGLMLKKIMITCWKKNNG